MINLKSNWLLQQDFAKKKSRTWNIVLNIVTEHCSHLINLTNGYFLLANRTKKTQITFLSWEKKIQFQNFFLLRKHRNFRDDLNQNTFCHLNNWSQISANGFCFIYKKNGKMYHPSTQSTESMVGYQSRLEGRTDFLVTVK